MTDVCVEFSLYVERFPFDIKSESEVHRKLIIPKSLVCLWRVVLTHSVKGLQHLKQKTEYLIFSLELVLNVLKHLKYAFNYVKKKI